MSSSPRPSPTGTRRGQSCLRRHHSPLLRYLTAGVGDPEEAAHLAQDTFLDAFRSLDKLAPDRPIAPWLFQIARNNLLPWWRRRGQLQVASLEAMVEGCDASLPTPLRQADDFVVGVEEGDVLRRVLEEMGPLLREALLLHALADLSGSEVAAVLGITPKAAEQRIGRAKAQARARYDELAGTGGTEAWGGDERHWAPERCGPGGVGGWDPGRRAPGTPRAPPRGLPRVPGAARGLPRNRAPASGTIPASRRPGRADTDPGTGTG